VSIDLLVRALLSLGVRRQEIARALGARVARKKVGSPAVGRQVVAT
jgi:hypothetical protein